MTEPFEEKRLHQDRNLSQKLERMPLLALSFTIASLTQILRRPHLVVRPGQKQLLLFLFFVEKQKGLHGPIGRQVGPPFSTFHWRPQSTQLSFINLRLPFYGHIVLSSDKVMFAQKCDAVQLKLATHRPPKLASTCWVI